MRAVGRLFAGGLVWPCFIGFLAAAPAPTAEITLRDLRGEETLVTRCPEGGKARVVVFLSADCPVANSYHPELTRLAAEFAPRGVSWVLVHADPATDNAAAKAHAEEYRIAASVSVCLDPSHRAVDALGAKGVPEAFVILPGGVVAYHGRISDWYAKRGVRRGEPLREDLRIALEEVLAGKSVSQPETKVVGCLIEDLKR